MKNTPYTVEERRRLESMGAKGKTLAQVSAALDREPNQVLYLARKMGVKFQERKAYVSWSGAEDDILRAHRNLGSNGVSEWLAKVGYSRTPEACRDRAHRLGLQLNATHRLHAVKRDASEPSWPVMRGDDEERDEIHWRRCLKAGGFDTKPFPVTRPLPSYCRGA